VAVITWRWRATIDGNLVPQPFNFLVAQHCSPFNQPFLQILSSYCHPFQSVLAINIAPAIASPLDSHKYGK